MPVASLEHVSGDTADRRDKFKIALHSDAACDNSSSRNDSHHRCSQGDREVGPGGNDDSEIAIGFRDISSAFGSSLRTRHVARCRLLTRIAFVGVRRNLFCSSVLRRGCRDVSLLDASSGKVEAAGIAPASQILNQLWHSRLRKPLLPLVGNRSGGRVTPRGDPRLAKFASASRPDDPRPRAYGKGSRGRRGMICRDSAFRKQTHKDRRSTGPVPACVRNLPPIMQPAPGLRVRRVRRTPTGQRSCPR